MHPENAAPDWRSSHRPIHGSTVPRTAPALALLALLVFPASAPAAFTESAALFGVESGDSLSFTAGFVDFDGDGDPDFFVTNHWTDADFFHNEAGESFVERSGHMEGLLKDRHDQLWMDLDNDGDPDQYMILGGGQSNQLFWNEGKDVLTEGAAGAGLQDTDGRGREVTAADFDRDGFLDLFVANDFRDGFFRPSALFWNNGNGTFTQSPNEDLLFRSRQHASAVDYDLDGFADILVSDPFATGELYQNQGDSTWVNVTESAFPGIADPLVDAQGLAWADHDNDGDLDLMVSSGNRAVWEHVALESDSLRYYAENESGSFREITFTTDGDSVTVSAFSADFKVVSCYFGDGGSSLDEYPARFGMDQILGEPPDLAAGTRGIFLWSVAGAAADTVHFVVGGPGDDLLVGGALRANGAGILEWSAEGFTPPPPYSTRDWTNHLYRNDGGVFADVTDQAFAVNDSTWNSKAAAWADYDNDGWIDLYVANGGTVVTGNEENALYRNQGDGTFEEVAAQEGVLGSTRGMSDGACWADVNGDGFVDLFVDHGAEHPPFGVGPRELFLGVPNGNHWVSLDLRGLASNGSGVGARVRFVSASGSQWRTRLGDSDNGFSNAHTLHVGLGADTVVDSIQVFWPSGKVDVHEAAPADTRFYAVEGEALRVAENPGFDVTLETLTDALSAGQIRTYLLGVDNAGGLASEYVAHFESCEGQAISWMTVDPESSTVFPGGRSPLMLTVDTAFLPDGMHCGRVVFESNSVSGPDTLRVNISVTGGVPVAAPAPALPRSFRLHPPRPNPTRTGVEFALDLPEPGLTEVTVFDLAGRLVVSLESGFLAAGRHRFSWDRRDGTGRRVAPGVYWIRGGCGRHEAARRIVVLE